MKLISVIYAIVCCIAGIVIPTAEALNNAWLDTVFGAIFLSYQLIVGIAFLIYLIVLSYVVRSKDKMHGAQSGLDLGPTRENDYCESRQTSTTCTGSEASLSRQTDSGDAESTASSSSVFWVDVSDFGDAFTHPETSLFLKLGSLVFSLGNLIYYGFESASYIYLDESCYVRSKYGWTFFLRLVFVLLQTYFMFKRPDGQIKCHQSFIWFGMLHLISTNLCLWFRTVIQEILEENHLDTDHHDGNDTSHPPINEMMITDGPTQYSDDGFTCNNSLLPNMTRYLFPFVLEYSLIAFGTIGAILHSLDQASTGNRKFPRDIQCVVAFTSSDPSPSSSAGDENPTSGTTSPSAAKEHEALSKAHTGFFVGALVMAGVVVSIILFHVKPENSRSFNNLPTVIYLITDACLHGLLLVGCIVAFILMRPLAYVPKAISMDDVLIVIAMCGSLVLDLSIVLSASDFVRARISRRSAVLDAARLASSVIAFAEVVIQALLLVFALRRYAARQQDVDRMPGRSVITMLIIGNVAVWIYRTVLAKGINTYREKQFYGEIPWLLIVNINLPLSLFFRFHCGICFADVWHLAYRPLKRTLYSGSVDPKAGALQRHCARTAGTENDAVQDTTTNFASQPAVRPALFRVRSGSLPCIHENLIVNHGKR